jgi:hypothetical protein
MLTVINFDWKVIQLIGGSPAAETSPFFVQGNPVTGFVQRGGAG